jgi:hypothetical protein
MHVAAHAGQMDVTLSMGTVVETLHPFELSTAMAVLVSAAQALEKAASKLTEAVSVMQRRAARALSRAHEASQLTVTVLSFDTLASHPAIARSLANLQAAY